MRFNENNEVLVAGEIISDFQFSHEVFGEKFYVFDLKVNRLSDRFDVLPIMVSERILDVTRSPIGADVEVEGQLRSYNKHSDGKSRVILSIFAETITNLDESENANSITMQGFICKEPIYRTTPFGREICDVLLAVNRKFNKSDYIPCIAWGNNAQIVSQMGVPTNLKIVGRIQSREYNKVCDDNKTITKTAYEVSISKLVNEQV